MNAPSYAVILGDTFLYQKSDPSKALFTLPKTYYVKVLESGENYTLVEYGDGTLSFPSVEGYCKTDEITFVDYVPARPYPEAEFTVTYLLEGGLNASPLSLKATYYGDYAVGSTLYCYAFTQHGFCYVLKPEIDLAENTDYLPPSSTSSFPVTPFLFGGALLLLLVLIVAVASKRKPPLEDYDS